MSQVTPTTGELASTIIAQLEGSLSQTIPLLPKSFSRVLAKVIAATVVLLYKYAGFIFLQIFVAHATLAETVVNGKKIVPLILWGELIGIGRPYAASRAELTASVSVLTQTGSLASQQKLLRSQTGVIYKTVASVPLDAATVQVTLRASSAQDGSDGSGEIGNLEAGDTLAFANTPANVASEVTVVELTVTGADAEDVEAYRARIIRRFQRRPQGGARADYQGWGEEVAGIVNVYPYAGDPGEVDVYVEATEASSGSADGIPTAAQLEAVAESIELAEDGLATRRPVGAAVNTLAITRVEFDVEIEGLDPDTTETRDTIEQGVTEYFLGRQPYIVGLSQLPRQDRITQVAVGGIVDDVVNADGAAVSDVTMDPGPSYTLGPGEKAKLGTLTFV
jgi:uncharacterized phage protein gp47/JayE